MRFDIILRRPGVFVRPFFFFFFFLRLNLCFLRRGPDVFTTRGPSVFGPGAAAPRSKGARSDRSVYARRAVSLNDTRNGDGKNGRTDGRGRKTKKITTTIITNNINKIRSLFFFSRDEPVSLFVRAPRRKKSGRPASRVPSRRVSDGPRTSDAFCPRRICRRESSRRSVRYGRIQNELSETLRSTIRCRSAVGRTVLLDDAIFVVPTYRPAILSKPRKKQKWPLKFKNYYHSLWS